MKRRAGIYTALKNEELINLCGDASAETLKLVLEKSGKFSFSRQPCFSTKMNGNWEWIDDMVGTYTTFEKINDSLYLHYPSDEITDTLFLIDTDQKRYITFTKTSSSLPGVQKE